MPKITFGIFSLECSVWALEDIYCGGKKEP